jgi:hypothetical protein
MRAVSSLWGPGGMLVVALAGAPGCRKEQAAVTGPEAGALPAAQPKAPRRRGEAGVMAVAVASSPVQLLPDTTVAVVQWAGLRALLGVVDIDAIIGKYRSYYDQAVQGVVAVAGHNLLDPGQWREIGVDAEGPMGAAVLDARSETYAGYFTISDREKFRAFLDRVGGSRRMQPVLEDRGLVLKVDADDSSALVLRDGFGFYVVTGRPAQAPYDFARLLAMIDPARGLTATPRYQRAVAGGEPGRSLTAYVDLWAFIAGRAGGPRGAELGPGAELAGAGAGAGDRERGAGGGGEPAAPAGGRAAQVGADVGGAAAARVRAVAALAGSGGAAGVRVHGGHARGDGEDPGEDAGDGADAGHPAQRADALAAVRGAG